MSVGANVYVWDIPTVAVTVNGKTRRRVDGAALQRLANRLALYGPDDVLLEEVWGHGDDGSVGAFSFGKATGQILQALIAAGLTPRTMAPQRWTRLVGRPKGKDASRELAVKHFPASSHLFKRKKDHNRADAALIALACARTA